MSFAPALRACRMHAGPLARFSTSAPASRRIAAAAVKATATPTRTPAATQNPPPPVIVTLDQTPTATPEPLPYFVHRTPNKNLPVYGELRKNGMLRRTRIRKVEGNLAVLREQLIAALDLQPDHIYINNLRNHIVIKGKWKEQVEKFLAEKQF